MNIPELNEQYRLAHWNENTEILDRVIKEEMDNRQTSDDELEARLNNRINTIKPVTATVLIRVEDWDENNTCVKTVEGMTVNKVVIVGGNPNTLAAYLRANVIATEQGENSLTFTCTFIPTTNIVANIMMFETA